METLVKETDAKNLKQAEYTQESWAVFEGAYADAKAVLENTDALQSEIDAAYEALITLLVFISYQVQFNQHPGERLK